MKKNSGLNRIFKLTLIFISVFLFFSCSGKSVKNTKSEKNNSVKKSVERIVCLSPSGVEIICALGGESKICAVTDYCDFPESVKTLPSVGGFSGNTISAEKILSYKPDFVYGSKGMHDSFENIFIQLGIKFYLCDADSVQSLYEEILFIGGILDCPENAENLIADMQRKIQLVNSNKKNKSVTWVYYEIWNTPFMSAGKKSFINDLINLSGARNIFEDVEMDYFEVSEESIVARNPDVIIIPDMCGYSINSVKDRNGWNEIEAVRQDKIYFIDSNIYSRPGPRIVDAIVDLSEKIK